MRDRLIELIKQGDKTFADKYTGKVMLHIDDIYEFIADYLLAKGVIVPPCKVGQTVYRVVEMSTGVTKVIKRTLCPPYKSDVLINCEPTIKRFIRSVVVTKNNFFDVCENWGISVFLTREEAEQALKGGGEK